MRKIVTLSRTVRFVASVMGGVLHKQQERSLANAVFGAMLSKRLSISSVGREYAKGADKYPKHGVKQVDRFVGNDKVDMEDVFLQQTHTVMGVRKNAVVSMDWTEFDATDQSRIAINLITRHGRATPLVWITAQKSKLKHNRSGYEMKALKLLKRSLPEGVGITVLADRGFCSTTLFSYIVSVRKPGLSWDSHMKEPWYLASSLKSGAEQIISLYGRRFTCEEQFRDEKDDRYGAGSKEIRVSSLRRRDMLTLIHALSTMLLTLLGEAGERIGYDRKLRANTARNRTHSLYRQGKEYIDGVHKSFVEQLRQMLETVIAEHRQRTEIYGVL